jgi:hypothetical protein
MLVAQFSPINNAWLTLLKVGDSVSLSPVGTEYRAIWNDLDELQFSMRVLGLGLERESRSCYRIVSGENDAGHVS